MTDTKFISGDAAAIKAFLGRFDTFLFDCDGVLWSGDHLLPRVKEAIDLLRSQEKRLVFVTNNSTKSRKDYAQKFSGFGITVDESEVFGSSYAAAIYISRILDLPADKSTVYALSESGTEHELRAEGIKVIGGTDPSLRRDVDPAVDFPRIVSGELLDPSVGAVLLALDFHVNYLKLALATAYVQRGAKLLATNTDSTLPHSGALFLGAGSIGNPVVNATGQQPIVLGKPHQTMMDAIEGKFQLDRARTCMVGDRLDTDIKFGNDGGLGGTLMVLTGVNKKEDIGHNGVFPSVVLNGLGDLLAAE